MIDILKEMEAKYGTNASMTAYHYNSDRTRAAISSAQKLWDENIAYANPDPFYVFSPDCHRDGDTPEEIAAHVDRLYGRIAEIVRDEFVRNLSRADAASLTKLLRDLQAIEPAKICICYDISLYGDEIEREWNESHPNEKPIYTPEGCGAMARRKYSDCERTDGDCTQCDRASHGRDCHDRPVAKLELVRRRAGLSQQQLAKKSGVNIRQIQRVELGESEAGNLTAKNLLTLAEALDVEPRDLL